MGKIKITVVLDEALAADLRRRVVHRRRSVFIAAAIRRDLNKLRDEELKRAYQEAYGEAEAHDEDLSGVTGDGID